MAVLARATSAGATPVLPFTMDEEEDHEFSLDTDTWGLSKSKSVHSDQNALVWI